MSGGKRNLLSVSTGIRIDIITHARWFVQHPKQALYQTEPRPDIELKNEEGLFGKSLTSIIHKVMKKSNQKMSFMGITFCAGVELSGLYCQCH